MVLSEPPIEAADGAVLVRLAVVPGASRASVVGLHGDRLKLRVRAAPERGRANRDVCRLLANELGVRERDVTIVAGPTNPRKTARIEGMELARAREILFG